MNIGIVGLPQTGKRTLFELLVGPGAPQRTDASKSIRGIAQVQDARFDRLVKIYVPKKETRARIEVILPPKIEEGAVSQGDIFRDLAEVDVFVHVVRAFEDDAVYHAKGSLDPQRDIDYVNSEFILHDLMFIEKRTEKLEKELMKVKDKEGQKELDLLIRLRETLENEAPLRTVELTEDEEKLLKSYPLLSRRELIVVLNISDSDVGDDGRINALRDKYAEQGVRCVQTAIEMESEIAALETDEEREEFMKEIGISENALQVLTRECIEALGLQSFFTAGPTEVHQWFVKRGANAVEAAGKIHSDLARGFIRAEVFKYADLIELGSEEKVKAAGKLEVKGRDYIVDDGDILYIRFNV